MNVKLFEKANVDVSVQARQASLFGFTFSRGSHIETSYNYKETIQNPDIGRKHQLIHLAHLLGITSIVSFLEPDYSPPYSFLSQQDILCLPSRYEGFGISALEAMLAGRVILISNSAGIAPHVQQSGCGILVNADKESIINGLQQLISRRSFWEEMGKAGQEYAMNNLNWAHIASNALVEYNRLCS